MKMTYLLKNKPKRIFTGKVIVFIFLFFLFFSFIFFFPSWSRSFSHSLARPFWFVKDVVFSVLGRVSDFLILKNALIKENATLKEEINLFKLKTTDYDILVEENLDLKKRMGIAGNRRIISTILAKPPQSPYDSLVIDAGGNKGISPGDKVYLSEYLIIGEIDSVTEHTSLVKLFSSGGNKRNFVLNRTGVSFSLVGSGGFNFSLEVPKDTDILEGDDFSYPGEPSTIVGKVFSIETSAKNAFKTVYIRFPANLFQSKFVFI